MNGKGVPVTVLWTCLKGEKALAELRERARARTQLRRLQWRVVWLLLLFPFLLALQRCWAGLVVSAPRAGRVFFPGEGINLGLRLDSATPNGVANYMVMDYWGNLVATGQMTLRQDQATTLSLGKLAQGWYRLEITLPDGWKHLDALCVLPPMTDCGRHHRLFGVCTTLDSQDRMDFLSYAGIRTIRRDWGWLTIEPSEGQWSPQCNTQRSSDGQRCRRMHSPVGCKVVRHKVVKKVRYAPG